MHVVDHPPRRNLSLAAPLVVAVEAVVLAAAALVALGPGLPGGGAPSLPPVVSPSPDASPSATPVPSSDPTPTISPKPTPTRTPTATPTPAATPTARPTPAPTRTPAPTARPTPTPPPVGGLPACRYDDLLTPHRSYADWQISLLDTIYRLPSDYHPGDLVDTAGAGLNGGHLVRRLLINDLRALTDAARANGTPVEVRSAFRSYARQQATFDYWVKVAGYEQALRTSARAGHSEHQLGTTVDFTSLGGRAPWEYADWAQLPAGAWMANNAWRYGFVMSYPKGRSAQTCYDYEPWHYRYVGRELAAAVRASGLTLREYLWRLR